MDRIEDIDPDDIEIPDTSVIKSMGPDPLHRNQRLRWDHKVQLIGEKLVDPSIYCCEKCALPILIYGRLIPCKHVFCYDCGKKMDKNCIRCGDAVIRIEKSALGTVFICTWGHTKHDVGGCRRTYLSQRDLSAHINYRHKKQPPPESKKETNIVSQQPSQGSLTSSTMSSQAGRVGHPAIPIPSKHLEQPRQKPSDEHGALQTNVQNLSINTHQPNVGISAPAHHSPLGLQQQKPPIIQQNMPPPQLQSQQGHMPHAPAPGMSSAPRPTGVPPPHSSAPGDAFQENRGHTNLITVQIQDDQDYRRPPVDVYQGRGNPNIPPTGVQTGFPIGGGPPPGFPHNNPPISGSPGSQLQPGHFIPQSSAPSHHPGAGPPIYHNRPDVPSMVAGQMHLGQGQGPQQRPPGPAGQMPPSGPGGMMPNPSQQMPPRPMQMPPGQPPMQGGMPPPGGQISHGPRPTPHGQMAPSQPPPQGQMPHPIPGGPPMRIPMQQQPGGPAGQGPFPNQQPGAPPFNQHHDQRMQWAGQNRGPVPMSGPPVGGPPIQSGVSQPQLPPPRTESGPYSQYY